MERKKTSFTNQFLLRWLVFCHFLLWDLGGTWVAFEVFLMLEIDVDGSLSSFEFLREIVGLVSSN